MRLHTAHTAGSDPVTLAAARTLLDGAFEGELTDSDALGEGLDRSGELTCDWRDGDVW
jgi:hypothetical protein